MTRCHTNPDHAICGIPPGIASSALSQYSLRTYACELVLGPKILNSAGFCRQTRSGFDCWMLRRGLPVKVVVWAAAFAILIKIYFFINRHYFISVLYHLTDP